MRSMLQLWVTDQDIAVLVRGGVLKTSTEDFEVEIKHYDPEEQL